MLRKIRTRLNCLFLCLAASLFVSGMAGAESIRTEMDANDQNEPLILDNFVTSAEPITFEQEFTLRLIGQALATPKSWLQKDKDVWVCWFQKRVGSNIKSMGCARNGDLWALRPNIAGGELSGPSIGSQETRSASYGRILWSNQHLRPLAVKRALAALPGSADYDREFIAKALAGERPPRDIPTSTELDQFSQAYAAIRDLDKIGASEQQLESEITASGLNLKRYNRIVELLDEYQSLKNEILDRLAVL